MHPESTLEKISDKQLSKMNKKTKLELEKKEKEEWSKFEKKFLGMLQVESFNEILRLSSSQDYYFKNHHTVKVDDLNLE